MQQHPSTDEIYRLFREHAKGFALGPFSHLRKQGIEADLARGLLHAPDLRAALLCAPPVRGSKIVHDFAGYRIAQLEPGDLHIKRIAYRERSAMIALLRAMIKQQAAQEHQTIVEIWQESAEDREIMRACGLGRIGTKIPAFAEIIGVYQYGGRRAEPPEERASLQRLALPRRFKMRPLLRAIDERVKRWTNHYSIYNKGDSWSALALRSFGGSAAYIEKPAEMARKWKAVPANARKLNWQIQDTPLRALLPEAEPIIAAIPGAKERIRLMRLAPNGGELQRHADITDPDCGIIDGKQLRIHIPIVTNDEVIFNSWTIEGKQISANMREGEAWYLDTRKPHTAINAGSTDRIHLVLDCASSPALRRLVLQGESAR